MEYYKPANSTEGLTHLLYLIERLEKDYEREGIDSSEFEQTNKFFKDRIAYFRDFYIHAGKEFISDDKNLQKLMDRFGLSAAHIRAMCAGKTHESLIDPKDPNKKEPNPFVEALVKKADDELEEFVRKALSGEIALTNETLHECMGYIKRKLVLSQLSLITEANAPGMDIETANLVKIQNQSVRMQLDSLEQTMKLLLADSKGDDLGLEEADASEV